MYDLHLHSTYSDGSFTVPALIERAAQAGLKGVSLTDHDGLWGLAEGATVAAQQGLAWLEGIEVSAEQAAGRVHIVGYSRAFDRQVIDDGLAETRAAHRERVEHLVAACQAAGYDRVSLASITERRAKQPNPGFVTFDVEQELVAAHGLSTNEAHQLTTPGGACYRVYDRSRALKPRAAIDLIHQAGGLAVLAHPGIISHEASAAVMHETIAELADQLDGLEVHHPFHSKNMTTQLTGLASEHDLLVTGGSDWHGEGRYDDTALGQSGITERQWHRLQERLP